MSIKLMSAIFAAKFTDLKDGAGNVTKASTAKLVLLALADHASDDGKGAYPSLTRVERKTGLNRKTIVNALDALKFNGMISLVGRSKLNTSNYAILMQAFPVTVEAGGASTPPLVAPVPQAGVTSTPPMVAPVHLNHPLTTIKPSREIYSGDFAKIWTDLEKLCGAVPPDTTRLIEVWLEKHLLERIHQAISLARDKRASSPKYVDQVLISWEANGYPPTREEQVLARAFKPAKGKNGTEQKRYKIPDYSEADLAVIDEINRLNALDES